MANGFDSNCGALVDLLESMEHFLKHLNTYTQIPPTPTMDDLVFNIVAELLSTLALATKELKQGRLSESVFAHVLLPFTQRNAVKSVKKGENDVEAVLQRLDRLTQDEARTTTTQILEVIFRLIKSMRIVMDGKSAYSCGILTSIDFCSI